VKDKSKMIEERRFALRFLIHCVDDMHTPIHVGDNHDRVGNDTHVRFFEKGTNMHRLWDIDMIERVSADEDVRLNDLASIESPRRATRSQCQPNPCRRIAEVAPRASRKKCMQMRNHSAESCGSQDANDEERRKSGRARSSLSWIPAFLR
jgi:hypothetical protein